MGKIKISLRNFIAISLISKDLSKLAVQSGMHLINLIWSLIDIVFFIWVSNLTLKPIWAIWKRFRIQIHLYIWFSSPFKIFENSSKLINTELLHVLDLFEKISSQKIFISKTNFRLRMTAAAAKSAPKASSGGSKGRGVFQDKEKPQHVSHQVS